MGLLNGNKLKNVARVLVSMLVVTTALVLLCSVAFAEEGASGDTAATNGVTSESDSTGTFNAPGTYNVGDVAFVNSLIANNGLLATPALEDGSEIPGDWGVYTSWTADTANKRLTAIDDTAHGPGIHGAIPDMSTLTALIRLDFFHSSIDSFASLPPNLEGLYCENANLTELPDLPETLEWLGVMDNELTSLPQLPQSLTSLGVYGNHLSELDLSGLDCTYTAHDQTLAYTLVGNSEDGWSIAINLNNPDPSVFAEGISYQDGKLISTDDTIATTAFSVDTGNLTESGLSGTITLTYENEQATPPPANDDPVEEDASEQATSMPATGDEAFAFLPGLAAVLSLGMGLVAFSARRKSNEQQ